MTEETGSPTGQITESQSQAVAALAFNYYQQGKLHEAETLFRGLQLLDPQAYYSHAGMGAVALAQSPPRLADAYRHLTKAAELNPDDPSVQTNLGEVLLRQAQPEEAAAHFKKAIELDPKQQDPGAARARAIVSGLTALAGEVKRIRAASSAA